MLDRCLGYRPDEFDSADQVFGGVRSSVAPRRFDKLRDFVPSILLQKNGQGCVGWSITQAIRVCHLRDGAPGELASAQYIWNNARIRQRELHLNTGTYFRTALEQCNVLGYCKETDFPSDEPGKNFNLEPEHLVVQAAVDQRSPVSFERIVSFGSLRREEVQEAIWNGRPVVFGTTVTRRFTELHEHEPQPVPDADEEIAGDHGLCGLAYDEWGLYGPNSWEDFGNAGWFALSWAYIEWVRTRDLWVINAPPTFSA